MEANVFGNISSHCVEDEAHRSQYPVVHQDQAACPSEGRRDAHCHKQMSAKQRDFQRVDDERRVGHGVHGRMRHGCEHGPFR